MCCWDNFDTMDTRVLRFRKECREVLGHLEFGIYLLDNAAHTCKGDVESELHKIKQLLLELIDSSDTPDREKAKDIITKVEALVVFMKDRCGFHRFLCEEITAVRVGLYEALRSFPELGAPTA